VDYAVEQLVKLQYYGPLALATDDTKLEKALQVYKNVDGAWMIVGNCGTPLIARAPPTVGPARPPGLESTTQPDADALDFDVMDILRDPGIEKAEKLRLYLLVIPMLKVIFCLLLSTRILTESGIY